MVKSLSIINSNNKNIHLLVNIHSINVVLLTDVTIKHNKLRVKHKKSRRTT